MNKIGSSAQKVEQIVKVLSEISGKLGMLSINASIEAARSGEAGRGFGVVASEINNLSTTTSENTRKAVQILGEIKDAVTSGRTIVNGTVQTFGSITTQFRDIAKLQFEIRNKSSEYSGKLNSLDNLNSELSEKSKFIFRDIKERNNDIMDLYKSIDDISKTFYEISERSEELTSTGEFLKQLSETLNSLVGKFKVEEKESPVTLKILPT